MDNLSCSEQGLFSKIQHYFSKIAPIETEEHIWQELIKAAGWLYEEIKPFKEVDNKTKYI